MAAAQKENEEDDAKLTDTMIKEYIAKTTAILDKYDKEYEENGGNDPCEPSEIIDSFLWLGSASNARKADDLQKLGITHILNLCAEEFGKKYDEKYNFKVCRIDADDSYQFKILSDEITKKSFKFIDSCKSDKNGKIFVHCVAGCNRSVTITIAYLIYGLKMNYLQAINHISSRRVWILSNDAFKKQLIEFAFNNNQLL